MPPFDITSWEQLRLAVSDLDPVGDRGFEGLLARLFSAEIGQIFYLARTGNQPAGDAHSALAGVALQAKRYTVSKIDENNVEGDIDRALRETPSTDVFVVAAVRADSQLKLRLEKKTEETGVDLLLLALGDSSSPLGALCLSHWDIFRDFFPTLSAASEAWRTAECVSPDFAAALYQFKSEISGLPTRTIVSTISRIKLQKRLQGEVLGNHAHNRVDIANSIERPSICDQLHDWWENTEFGAAVLKGEEGAGKTWVAAEFLNTLRGSTAVILWLDSLAWAQVQNVEAIVRIGLVGLFPPNDVRVDRVLRKIFRRWHEPILIALDGANERTAWEAAERILYDYAQHSSQLGNRVRLLFTSRPLNSHRGGRQFWRTVRTIPVGPFDDSEFAAALSKFAPGIRPDVLTNAVRELARIPRYFRLCLQLRDKLASFSHLNRQILLWADLEAKLEAHDPQWLGLQHELGGTPSEILAYLAKQLGWPAADDIAVATLELKQYLPGLYNARADLQEQRIVVSASLSEIKLSTEHLVLGWALILQRVADDHSSEGADLLCDRLLRLIEPAASNDDKARAVHVAALLTFFSDSAAASVARVALLRLWALHHNANLTTEALSFFLGSDLQAFVLTVEALFRKHLPGDFEATLIQPLIGRWQQGGADSAPLRAVLERWLRLIFPGDKNGSKERNRTPPPHFLQAETSEQLRLSYAAISIISFRPELELLPALADCYRSVEYCYMDEESSGTSWRLPVKSPFEPLGLLVRWSYGETGLTELARLKSALDLQSDEAENLCDFARLWRFAKMPAPFRSGDANDILTPSGTDVSLLADFREALANPDSRKRNIIILGLAGRLAVRRDLEEMTSFEIEQVAREVEAVISGVDRDQPAAAWDEQTLRGLLPFLARYSPDLMRSTLDAVWKSAIGSADAWQRLWDLRSALPGSDSGVELVAEIAKLSETLPRHEHVEIVAERVTEFMLFYADKNALLGWLHTISAITLLRSKSPLVCILPLPTAIAELAPDDYDSIARREFEASVYELDRNFSDEGKKRACHWLQILAYVSRETSLDLARWAFDLADRFRDDDEFKFPLFLIIIRCSDPAVFEKALRHHAFKEYQIGFHVWRWSTGFSRGAWPTFVWNDLKTYVSFNAAGWILYRSGNDGELCKWGQDFAIAALAAISSEPMQPPRASIQVQHGAEGHVEGIHLAPFSEGRSGWMSVASPSWGVEREINLPGPTQADADRQCDALHADMKARRSSARREFVNFNASGPLDRWRRISPKEYSAWAEEFLARVSSANSAVSLEMAYLIASVTASLLRAKPDTLTQLRSNKSDFLHVRVVGTGGVILHSEEVLWERELNDSATVLAARQRLLLNANCDEAILWQVLAAHSNWNSEAVGSLARTWLISDSASERALGVSIAAFQGDEDFLSQLQRIRDGDASFWVRQHAGWATDVCASEVSCRRRYREILSVDSFESTVAGFVELREALSPLALAWSKAEADRSNLSQFSKRTRAAVRLFWEHWKNSSSVRQNISIAGRKLKEYCRGERLKNGVSNRMAPWWRPCD